MPEGKNQWIHRFRTLWRWGRSSIVACRRCRWKRTVVLERVRVSVFVCVCYGSVRYTLYSARRPIILVLCFSAILFSLIIFFTCWPFFIVTMYCIVVLLFGFVYRLSLLLRMPSLLHCTNSLDITWALLDAAHIVLKLCVKQRE